MKTLRTWCIMVLSCVFLAAPVQAAEPVTIKTAWMPEFEAFVTWYAIEKGWDKEAGINVRMEHFESGKKIVNEVKDNDWDIAGIGAVPALVSYLGDTLEIIAIACDESSANTIFVKPDSPILKTRGANPEYPNVYGSADSVRNARIVCPLATSAHYALTTWLKTFGLTTSDVYIKNMNPLQALDTFGTGSADVLALWAPDTYTAEQRGFPTVGTSADLKINLPMLLVAKRMYVDKHPEQVEAFLKMYMRVVNEIRSVSAGSLAEEYVRFYKTWVGRDISVASAEYDILTHPVLKLDEQLLQFNETTGQSPLKRDLMAIITAYYEMGNIKKSRMESLTKLEHVNDTFLRKLNESK